MCRRQGASEDGATLKLEGREGREGLEESCFFFADTRFLQRLVAELTWPKVHF